MVGDDWDSLCWDQWLERQHTLFEISVARTESLHPFAFLPLRSSCSMATQQMANLVKDATMNNDGGLAKCFEVARVHPDLVKLFNEEDVTHLSDFISYFRRRITRRSALLSVTRWRP